MTVPDEPDLPVEHDPTGIRALLSSLPDPGPMPADLVERITASLAAERERDADVIPFVAQPRRRPTRLRQLGLAAAVAAVAVSGGVALMDRGPGVVGAFTHSSAESASGTVASARAKDAPAQQDSRQGVGGTTARSVSIHASGRAYAAASLARDAAAMAAAPGAAVGPFAAETPAVGPIATPLGASTCAAALGITPAAALTVDLGSYGGEPAAVVVSDAAGTRTAYVVARSCTTGHAGLLAGPVTLP